MSRAGGGDGGRGGPVAVAVLAAGRGRRFLADVPKPLALLEGRPLVAHALAAATGSGLSPVLLVVGHRGDEVASAAPPDVRVVANPRWAEGLSTSLRAAITALLDDGDVDAVAVGLADQPGLGAEAYRRLAGAHRDGAAAAVATYGGVWGHPVLLGRPLWERALTLEGDAGARRLLSGAGVVEVPCDGTGSTLDVDTVDDLGALRAGGVSGAMQAGADPGARQGD